MICEALRSQGTLKSQLRPLSEAVKQAFDWVINYPNTTVKEEKTDANVVIKIIKTTNRCVAEKLPYVFIVSLLCSLII